MHRSSSSASVRSSWLPGSAVASSSAEARQLSRATRRSAKANALEIIVLLAGAALNLLAWLLG